jgi:DNA phosphorothioation-dependent restriction protein DptH
MISTYYQRVIELILNLYREDLKIAIPGHCMKITGLGFSELEYLWSRVKEEFPEINVFIISNLPDNDKCISASKLIEYRNQESSPLLILIPSNSRTAAEDSYGNATFKEISLDGIEENLKTELIKSIPTEYSSVIANDILGHLRASGLRTVQVIKYLLELEKVGYNNENIGNRLYHLNLIPDSILVSDLDKIKSRLNFNLDSIQLIASFNKPLYDRISELPLESNTLQKDIIDFLKNESELKSVEEICFAIFNQFQNLNFSNWSIPELDFKEFKLIIEEIKSNDFKIEDGVKVLHAGLNSTSSIKIKFNTNPPPNATNDLKYFKVILMAVDGFAGEEVAVIRKLKNSASTRPYREVTVDLNSNITEEGSYFFKVLAEDEHGNTLNFDDDFKDSKIQSAWDLNRADNPEISKSEFPYKRTCDTEDFFFVIGESVEREENQRKDKLNNVLQAFFKFRIDNLKAGNSLIIPSPIEGSNIWINDISKHTSTLHIRYSEKHNYQINLSSKLRLIENEFLNKGEYFGYVKSTLKSNSAAVGFENIKFVESSINPIVPEELIKARKKLFTRIISSNESDNGLIETADLFNFKDEVILYIRLFAAWIENLNEKLFSKEIDTGEASKLQEFLSELQFLDLAKVKTKLPNGDRVAAVLLSPLHPLRLVWMINLMDVFEDWESQTNEFRGHLENWAKSLEDLFEGKLSYENNPLIIVDPNEYLNYNYAGELSFGWGLYLLSETIDDKRRFTSNTRHLKQYYRQLLNISKENYVETEISQKLIMKHLKNYVFQHPYTDSLVINLINAGDATIFADCLVELEKEEQFKNLKYEIRIFKGEDKIIEHGEGFKKLLNPEYNITEEAESFSQPSKNRLFPKLRYSINEINDYLTSPSRFNAHLSFVVSPFPVTIELIKPFHKQKNFFLNGLISDSSILVEENNNEIKWNRFLIGNELIKQYSESGNLGIRMFNSIQSFTSGALASKPTESIPSTQLRLNDKDKVLLAHLHDYSDWVVTFDKNLGPQIYDQPSKEGKIPFLLDYVPGEEVNGISSFLTTRPTSEVLGLLGPHFSDFGLNIHDSKDERRIKILLEDLRAISSSLVLQLNSSKNKAFEVIGSAFTKRVLEKKGFLADSFLIPIDLHQELFEKLPLNNKSRADNLLVSIDPDKKTIIFTVIEIKCRQSLAEREGEELKIKMKEQIENTVEALRFHFDTSYQISFDRLDREIKNKELRSLLTFYVERAYRYNYLSENAYATFIAFLQELDLGFSIEFKKIGLIYNFSAAKKQTKEVTGDDITFFTFGHRLIEDILDPDSDLNTKRLEDQEEDNELLEAIGNKNHLKPFIQQFKVPSTRLPDTSPVESSKFDSVKTSIDNNLEDKESTPNYSEKGIGAINSGKPIRLGKAARSLNTSIASLVDFLKSKGINVDVNPNSKIYDEQFNLLKEQFSNHIKPDQENEIQLKSDEEQIDLSNNDSQIQVQHTYDAPNYDILIGKSSPSDQYGILGETIHGKKIAIDLSETNTISLFGVQGGGKSYTIGTISEMVLKNFEKVNLLPSPLAGVIFHYSESMDYEPEFTSMIYPNDKEGELKKLKERYGADPDNIEDVIILTPSDKIEERQSEFPSIKVLPIAFNSNELNVQDWMFLLGAIGNDSAYIKQLKAIMKEQRRNLSIDGISQGVEDSILLSNSQKALARQKLSFAREYINDGFVLKDTLKPGRLIIVDLRDEFIVKEEALGLFVIMLNIFSSVKTVSGNHFNKFIVFDEAHKYMDNKDLTSTIVTSIREMRHKGVSIMIASQDPPSLPNEIIELSSIVLLHKFNSPQWLKHIQKSITQLTPLQAADMSVLNPGEGFLWSTKATDRSITNGPVKISTRPRVTKHGGATIQATGNK